MRIAALVPYPLDTTPSQRFRLEQWRALLPEHGIQLEIFPFADSRLMRTLYTPRALDKAAAFAAAFSRRAALLPRLLRFDAVVVHRAACLAGPALLERLIARKGAAMFLDFDDAIFRLHTSAANRRLGWLKFPGKTAALCRLATRVVVGNSYLADYAKRYNQRVSIVPTSIDVDRYRPSGRAVARGRVVIGWTGSSTSQTHLEAFAGPLRRLAARGDVELRVISNRRFELPGVPVSWRPWSAETEVEEIGKFDVGIMPMPDDEWSKGKCALKLLQYMALGIPTVGSAVGANLDVIQHGENGLLARSDEEWVASLERLAVDHALRLRLGRAGRLTVEQGYSMRRCAGLFAVAIREGMEERRAAAA